MKEQHCISISIYNHNELKLAKTMWELSWIVGKGIKLRGSILVIVLDKKFGLKKWSLQIIY